MSCRLTTNYSLVHLCLLPGSRFFFFLTAKNLLVLNFGELTSADHHRIKNLIQICITCFTRLDSVSVENNYPIKLTLKLVNISSSNQLIGEFQGVVLR